MDDMKRLESKIDVLGHDLKAIDKTLLRNTLSLEDHMKRTRMIEEQLEPVKKHVDLMNNIAKIIVFIGILAAIYKNLR